MGIYSKKKLLAAHASQISAIADAIQNDFMRDGFEVNVDTLMSGARTSASPRATYLRRYSACALP